jgi:hypothetical protein
VRWSHIVFMLRIHCTILETVVVCHEPPTIVLMEFRWGYNGGRNLMLDWLWQDKVIILFSCRGIVARNRNLFGDYLYCLLDPQLLFWFLILPKIERCSYCSSLILHYFSPAHLSSCHPALFRILKSYLTIIFGCHWPYITLI